MKKQFFDIRTTSEKVRIIIVLTVCSLTINGVNKSTIVFLAEGNILSNSVEVGLYKVFELQVKNEKNYSNKFTDVELTVTYHSPSGSTLNFWGFYDGNGNGSGDKQNGNIWKLRFMPNELGKWAYEYKWSDGTQCGSGTFECVSNGEGKGILQPYKKNPHWFAYNGTNPVWLKSYYETGHGAIGQDFNWVIENVYSPLIKTGYNHLQVNWLLSLCCFEQYYHDGPEPETKDLLLYKEGDLFGTMNFDVWKRMERNLSWLNDHNVGVHMFLGVDGSKNNGPEWGKLSLEEKDWFVKYTVSRLSPYANLAGWNFVWEIPGNRKDRELEFMQLIMKYDIFNHLRTYEDEAPRDNEFDRAEYTFAAVENHNIAAGDKNMERNLWKEPWTHHMACLLGYKGKPVFMSEGNALWRRFWQERSHATQDDLRRAAWACATAGASCTWNGHPGEENLYAHGPEGLPFSEDNPYRVSEKYIDILTDIMNNEVEFYKMIPQDNLLSDHPALSVYALAETGNQYLVFTTEGASFSLQIEKGIYSNAAWIDTETENKVPLKKISVDRDKKNISFTAPNHKTDWVLIIKK